MKLIDTNIIIYAANPAYQVLTPLLKDPQNAVSIITTIETLGYPQLSESNKLYLEKVFQVLQILDLDATIAQKAIELKQHKKMAMGDAIIAATALIHNVPLVTRNIDDFKHLKSLKLLNPFKEK
jgi:predicted nucleic acid-binding protein